MQFTDDSRALQRLRTALGAAGAALYDANLATGAQWWSPEMFAIHGLDEASAPPSNYLAVVHPDDRALVARVFQDGVSGAAHDVEYRVLWPDSSWHWIESKGTAIRDEQTGHHLVSGVCTLIDARKRQEADLRFLSDASAEIARSTDYQQTLQRVASMAVPHFADWCAVDMLYPGDELRRVAVAHVDPAKVELARQLHGRYPPDPAAPVGVWNVIRTGAPELLPDIPQDLLEAGSHDAEHLDILRSLALRSYMGVPIRGAGDRIMGVVSFVSSSSGRRYTPHDLQLATDLVGRAAVAIQNAELFGALVNSHVNQNLLLELTDVLRDNGTTAEILTRISALLGQHFRVDRVGYGHVDEHLDQIEYDVCWTDGTVPALLGSFPASAFGQQVIDRLRSGETVAIANVREHPDTSDHAALRTSHEVETRAILVVPLSKAGRLRTIVYLNQGPQREWTRDEIRLMEEVAERTRELIERGRAEQALRSSEARWRGLFERMAEGFFTAEVVRDGAGRVHDFRFLEVNPAFETLTGIAPQQAIGRLVTQVIPGLQTEVIDTYGRVADTGIAEQFEVEVAALGGRWYEARASRIGPDQFSVLFVEVTERKASARELVRSAERYRTLFESIDEGFCILEMIFDADRRPVDYRFLEVNPAFERQSGLLDAVGRTIRDLVPSIELSYIDTYGQVALTGRPIRFESHAAALGRWFDAFAFRVGAPDEARVALLFTDITERKLAQQAVANSESRLREAQELANLGSWRWDPLSDRTEVSPELRRIFGLQDAEQLPPFAEQRGSIYDPADWQRLNEAVQDALAGTQAYALDLRAFRRGQPIWVTARGSAVRDDAGRIVGLAGTVQDITDRKAAELALRDADRKKNEFLATLAHELRNPLAPLRNGLTILDKVGASNDLAVRTHALMDRQLTQLVRLVDDLLDVSRVSQGKLVLKRSVHALQDIVDTAVDTSRPLIDLGRHRLEVEMPQAAVMMTVDATRIAQVVSNLLNNAARYTPEAGRIKLQAHRSAPDRVEIVVTDNGIGIPQDMLETVFELFTQVGDTPAASQSGLGVGLSLARQLVRLHGGSLRASSAGRGRGSTFTVELPALPELTGFAHAANAPRTSVDAGCPRSVLVVDDNIDAAETLQVLLEMAGHSVRAVYSGEDALHAALSGEVPQTILLDIGLPGLSGYDVARELRQRPAFDRTVLVALTGWGAERDQQRARAAGFDLHLTKPVSAADLSRALTAERTRDALPPCPGQAAT